MIGEPLRGVDLRALRCQKGATFTPAESGESARGDDSVFPQLGIAAWVFLRIDNFVVIRSANLSSFHQTVQLVANVMMMCGCPTTPGGVWDANKYEGKALLKKDGTQIGELALRYAGTTSQFAGTWTVQESGIYEATVYAYDPANGNTGVDSVTFVVEP